jgi:hypothetical protein
MKQLSHLNSGGTFGLILAVAVYMSSSGGHAALTVFVNQLDAWRAAAGATTTVDFVEPGPAGYIYADHYISQGLTLDLSWTPTDPQYSYWYRLTNDSPGYAGQFHDNGGLKGVTPMNPALAFEFTEPIYSFARTAPATQASSFYCYFYLGDEQVGFFTYSHAAGTIGAVSDVPFDRVATSMGLVDDIHFGVVPAPSTAILLLLSTCARRSRVR